MQAIAERYITECSSTPISAIQKRPNITVIRNLDNPFLYQSEYMNFVTHHNVSGVRLVALLLKMGTTPNIIIGVDVLFITVKNTEMCIRIIN